MRGNEAKVWPFVEDFVDELGAPVPQDLAESVEPLLQIVHERTRREPGQRSANDKADGGRGKQRSLGKKLKISVSCVMQGGENEYTRRAR